MNKVFLLGNVGQEPDTRPTKNGFLVSFSVATTKVVKKEKHTQWHKVTCFGTLADIMSKYLHKGSKVLVEGEINYTDRINDKGEKTVYTNIIARHIDLLNKIDKSNEDVDGNTITEDELPF